MKDGFDLSCLTRSADIVIEVHDRHEVLTACEEIARVTGNKSWTDKKLIDVINDHVDREPTCIRANFGGTAYSYKKFYIDERYNIRDYSEFLIEEDDTGCEYEDIGDLI